MLAVGSTIADFGIPGVTKHCYVLDTVEGADQLHRTILAVGARVSAGLQERLRVAVVGAGTTGVELAAGFRSATKRLAQYRSLVHPSQVDVTIVEMADRPLPGVSSRAAEYARRMLRRQQVEERFGASVKAVEAGLLRLSDGSEIRSDIIVWCSGVSSRSMAVSPPPRIERAGRMRVDPCLRLCTQEGQTLHNAYALGDCAASYDAHTGKAVGATAQAAHQQARLLARSLAGQTRGHRALRFTFKDRGVLVSLGTGKAVGTLPAAGKAVRITGLTANLAYGILYQAHLREVFGTVRTAAMALASALRRRAAPSTKLHW